MNNDNLSSEIELPDGRCVFVFDFRMQLQGRDRSLKQTFRPVKIRCEM